MNYIAALVVLKKFWPVAKAVVAAAVDGKITKEEVLVIVEMILADKEVIYIWGNPDA